MPTVWFNYFFYKMINKKHILLAIFFSLPLFLRAQNLPSNKTDETIFKECLQTIKNAGNKENGMVTAAKYFLEVPYVAATLETKEREEQLVVNLRSLDCMTLVENCLALNLTAQVDTADFETFKQKLQSVRYRNGIIDGYPSRLHYTSDWIFDNEKAGVLKDKTKSCGGEILPLSIDFMSTHPESYPYLQKHPETIEVMKQFEDSINKRTYYYIPKEKIEKNSKKIQDGDIICFVTSVKGLDISHLGIAYRKNGMLTFIHASSNAKKVIINPESIADYCAKQKKNKGIMIARTVSISQK